MNIDSDDQELQYEEPYDLAMIKRGIARLCEPGSVYEVRALGAQRGTISGYFDGANREDMAECCAEVSGDADGVYFTLNPVLPDVLARAVNRLRTYAKFTTSDAEITQRRWLPLDFDPVRPAGISSTDSEHEAALAKARKCREYLRGLGFSKQSLVLADSGNGAHLLCRIALPNDEAARDLVKSCIDGLAALFSDDQVKVDRTTFNAARIWKVPGTLACKGDHIDARPHRLARLLSVPKGILPTSDALLQKLAATAPPKPEPALRPTRYGGLASFDIDAWLSEHGVAVASPKPWNGGRLWVMPTCPWNSQHTNGAAFIVQSACGALSARCHHDSCQGNGWSQLRELVEGKSEYRRKLPVPKSLIGAPAEIVRKFNEAVYNQSNCSDRGN